MMGEYEKLYVICFEDEVCGIFTDFSLFSSIKENVLYNILKSF